MAATFTMISAQSASPVMSKPNLIKLLVVVKKRYVFVAALFVVVVIMFQVPIRVPRLAGKIDREKVLPAAAQYGDMFGVANALFSGFALTGLIATLLLQIEELRVSRKASEEQVQLAAKTALLTALPSVIEPLARNIRERFTENLPHSFPLETATSAELIDFIKTTLEPARQKWEHDAHRLTIYSRVIDAVSLLANYRQDLEALYSSIKLAQSSGRVTAS